MSNQILNRNERKAMRKAAVECTTNVKSAWVVLSPPIHPLLTFPPMCEELKIRKQLKFLVWTDVVTFGITGRREKNDCVIFAPCCVCGEEHPAVALTYLPGDNDYICRNCTKEFTRLCDRCSHPMLYDHPSQQTRSVVNEDGLHQIVCKTCRPHFAKCDDCGHYFRQTWNGRCKSCKATYMATRASCSACGDIFSKDLLTNGRCPDCYRIHLENQMRSNSNKERKVIIRYGETQARVFLKGCETGIRVFGLEWEGENGYESDDQPKELLEELFKWREIDLKEDGSVDRGFEIAIQPCDLEYIRTHLDLPGMMKILKKHGFKSHDCLNDGGDGKAGFHIHVNLASFGDSERKRAKAIAYFSFMWQRKDFRDNLKTFSRRNDYHYCEFYSSYITTFPEHERITVGYAAMVKDNKEHRNRMLNFWRHKYVNGTYTAIRNTKTVEVRLMRGHMGAKTLIAAVELVNLFAEFACAAKTDADIRKVMWEDVCNKAQTNGNADLVEYLKKKNLWRV